MVATLKSTDPERDLCPRCGERLGELPSNLVKISLRDAEIERLRAALLPVAKIPLWRDTYPDATTDHVADELNFVTAEQIREARRLCGYEQQGNKT